MGLLKLPESRKGGESGAPPIGSPGKASTARQGLPPAIRTEGLTRKFGELRAVVDLDLQVPRNSIFGFLGPNGAGKTTTIRLLLGLLSPSRGRAEVLGYDVAARSSDVRRRCGVLLEHTGLTGRLTALENLEIHARIWRLPKRARQERVRALLGDLGLWDRRDDRVESWSRGMRQRLAIARALLHRPSLLFLDEPTAGLDPVAAASLRTDLVRLARQEGVTVFLNTHNLLEAERLCDRIGVIRGGRLLCVGPPEELRALSRSRRLRLAGRDFTENVLDHLRQRREVLAVTHGGDHLLLDLRDGEEVAPLVGFLVRLGVQVEEVRRVDNSLEDVFLSLVRDTEARSRPRRAADLRGVA